MKTGIIYKYTSPRGLVYIGQTVRPKERMNQHKKETSKQHTKFGYALKKYGYDEFDYEVLETIEADTRKELDDKLDEREIFYIEQYDSFKNGYNSTTGGKKMYKQETTNIKILDVEDYIDFLKLETGLILSVYEGSEMKEMIENDYNSELFDSYSTIFEDYDIEYVYNEDDRFFILFIRPSIIRTIDMKGLSVPLLYCKIKNLKSFFKDYTNDYENSCKDDYYRMSLINNNVLIWEQRVKGFGYMPKGSLISKLEYEDGLRNNIVKDNWKIIYE